MDYTEAIAFLDETRKIGSKPGLLTIGRLLKELGSPQEGAAFVHVAGTNGKGSVSTYIAYILAEAGYKTGRFSSPPVFQYEEMIQLLSIKEDENEEDENREDQNREDQNREDKNREDKGREVKNKDEARYGGVRTVSIGREEIASCIGEIQEACLRMVQKGWDHPTVFEVETAMAFLYFRKKNCDIAVLETGMGGSLDATNIISAPKCAVLTSISMDHMEYLGNSLGEIAAHKAGIIKEGVPVISCEQEEEAKQVIRGACRSKGARLAMADLSKITVKKMEMGATVFDYEDLKEITISLPGINQVYNGATAILAAKALRDNGFFIEEEHIRRGLKGAVWPGRFEFLPYNPTVILDGAHNEGAGRLLEQNIQIYLKNKVLYYIMGVFGDKDYRALIRHTCPYAKKVYCITPPSPRALPSWKLAEAVADSGTKAEDGGTVSRAFELIERDMEIDGRPKEECVILAFGSLSILKDVKEEAVRISFKQIGHQDGCPEKR